MNPDVSESDLPGIGRRYEVACSDGASVTVVIHNSGRRDLYVFPSGAREPAQVTLGDTQARGLGAVLGGTYFTPPTVRDVQDILDQLTFDWATLTPGSPGADHTIGDLGIRSRTGIAVLAIRRGRETVFRPDADETLRAGDQVVVAGRREDMPGFLNLVIGGR